MISVEQVQNNWEILTGFVVGAVAWGKTAATAYGARKSVDKAHERINENQKDVGEIKSAVARIETHQTHMLKGIDEIKNELRLRR